MNDSLGLHHNQLPKPYLKVQGDELEIQILENEYRDGVEGCKNNLHGTLILAKWMKPWKMVDLRQKLLNMWKLVGSWNVISLEKRLFKFSLSCSDDFVKGLGKWLMNFETRHIVFVQLDPGFQSVCFEDYSCSMLASQEY